MPFKSKKQRKWLQINRPDIYKRWKAEHGTDISKKKSKPKRKK